MESGADLQRATVIELWQQYLTECQQVISERLITINLLKQLGHFTRNFAKTYPARYQVMMQVQLQPSDPEAAVIIQQLLNFLRQTLNPYDLTDTQLIDVMRMLNAAIYGFIAVDQAGLMTLERSTSAPMQCWAALVALYLSFSLLSLCSNLFIRLWS